MVKCHNPSHGTAHIPLTCRDSGQFTALRTEKDDITTGRAAVYRRFECVTCNMGSALSPSSFCSSFRSWLLGDSTKLSAYPAGGPSLRLLPLTHLVLPVTHSSCHLMLRQVRTASACSLQHLKHHLRQVRTASACSLQHLTHQIQRCSHSAERCAVGKLNTHTTRDPPRRFHVQRNKADDVI